MCGPCAPLLPQPHPAGLTAMPNPNPREQEHRGEHLHPSHLSWSIIIRDLWVCLCPPDSKLPEAQVHSCYLLAVGGALWSLSGLNAAGFKLDIKNFPMSFSVFSLSGMLLEVLKASRDIAWDRSEVNLPVGWLIWELLRNKPPATQEEMVRG